MGSAFGIGLAALFLLAIVIGMNAWILVPIAVLALGALFAAPIAALFKAADVGTKDSSGGTVSTREAAYDPVTDPAEQGRGTR